MSGAENGSESVAGSGYDLYRGRIPTACPCCGALSLPPLSDGPTLLAVCDTLCIKTLEHLGKYIVRAERSRYKARGDRPFFVMHTLWKPDDHTVDKALRGAWDVIPALLTTYGCCDVTSRDVTRMLDSYVHDLAVTGTQHRRDELEYRFTHELGMPVRMVHAHPDEFAREPHEHEHEHEVHEVQQRVEA